LLEAEPAFVDSEPAVHEESGREPAVPELHASIGTGLIASHNSAIGITAHDMLLLPKSTPRPR
jgi:hypothetical protein